jgi:hypothetical protein
MSPLYWTKIVCGIAKVNGSLIYLFWLIRVPPLLRSVYIKKPEVLRDSFFIKINPNISRPPITNLSFSTALIDVFHLKQSSWKGLPFWITPNLFTVTGPEKTELYHEMKVKASPQPAKQTTHSPTATYHCSIAKPANTVAGAKDPVYYSTSIRLWGPWQQWNRWYFRPSTTNKHKHSSACQRKD